MAEYTGDFETGSDGARILVSDSGSATPWNDVQRGADGNSPTYSNTQRYGLLSAKVSSTVAGSDGGYLAWTSTTLGTSLTMHYGRMYLYLPNTTTSYLVYGFDNLNALAWRILLDTTFVIRDAAGSNVTIGAVTPSTNQWIRFEWKIVSNVASGLAEFKLFNSPDSTIPDETKTSAACNTSTETSLMRFGNPSLSAASSTWYFDNIMVNDTGYPGPDVSEASAFYVTTL